MKNSAHARIVNLPIIINREQIDENDKVNASAVCVMCQQHATDMDHHGISSILYVIVVHIFYHAIEVLLWWRETKLGSYVHDLKAREYFVNFHGF